MYDSLNLRMPRNDIDRNFIYNYHLTVFTLLLTYLFILI